MKRLEQLADAQLQVNDWKQKVDVLAVMARREGASWVQIGRALGMSKQSAQRRFSKFGEYPESYPGHGA
jgi:hypothetical protein